MNDPLVVLHFVLGTWACYVLSCCHTLIVVQLVFHFEIEAAGRDTRYWDMR